MSLAVAGSAILAEGSGGPFDLINGLPVHPLVVHAVVILVPIAALGLIVMAASPTFSRRFGIVVVLASIGATGAAFVAKQAGEALEERVGEPGFDHAELGDVMPFFALALMVAVIALWLVDRRADPDAPWTRNWLRISVAAASVVVALASLGWVYRVGDSGAKSVWSDEVSGTSAPSGDTDND